jgi:3-isopropylmalate dehydrogenase
MSKRFAILPGDGIGVDVSHEAVKILERVASTRGLDFEIEHFGYGAEHYLKTGETLPDHALEKLKTFDAIFMGALGDPRVPDMAHARDILLGTRFKLDLFINLRPIRCVNDALCPLRKYKASDIDFVVFRENTEGAYVGMGGIFKKGTADEIAIQEDVNTRKGVERIIRAAFEYARSHNRSRVTMSDKSNAMRYGHDLWTRVFEEVGSEYDDIEKDHFYVDALTMALVRDPRQFEVIVTCNMFGDIVTDIGAQLQGGLGMAASGNLHPGQISMFEPVHGSAPKYAGKEVANPFGAILTAAMMLEHSGLPEPASWIEGAVRSCLAAGECTRDVGGGLGTTASGDAVARRLEQHSGTTQS